jgi:hypothetical protein
MVEGRHDGSFVLDGHEEARGTAELERRERRKGHVLSDFERQRDGR